jgi:predicted outer membrane repeat protein
MESRLLLATIFVDAAVPGSIHNGFGWSSAYTDLQQALAVASPGDVIKVADGVYKPTSTTDITATFQLKSGVSLLGGYAGYGAANPDARDPAKYVSILSGDIGVADDFRDNSQHVLTASGVDNTAVLEGLTIRDGHAHGSTTDDRAGAGLFCVGGSPTIADCVFQWNIADSRGAGMICRENSAPVLTNCQFIENSALAFGGGLNSESGSSLTLSHCTFLRNDSGGLYAAGPNISLDSCLFFGNYSYLGTGGGAYLSSNGQIAVENCVFSGNFGDRGAGMLLNAYEGSDVATVDNCTFAGNVARFQGGGIYASSYPWTMSNCILWGNSSPTGPDLVVRNSTPTVSFTDIPGGWMGTGNLNLDPKFVRAPSPGPDAVWGTEDDDYGDLRLQPTSPCIDSGSNAFVSKSTDVEYNPRLVDVPGVRTPGIVVDMGAYERPLGLVLGSPTFLINHPQPTVRFTASNTLDLASLSAADVVVRTVLPDGTLGGAVVASSVRYDAAAKTLLFQLPASLPSGNYRALLPGAAVSDTYSGTFAADMTVDLFFLGGDANQDRKVDITDLAILALNWQGSGKVFSQGDFNYDGRVDAKDLGILSLSWQQSLPPPVGVPAPTSATRAPTRLARRLVSVIL